CCCTWISIVTKRYGDIMGVYHCGWVSSQRICLRLQVAQPVRDLVWLFLGGPPPAIVEIKFYAIGMSGRLDMKWVRQYFKVSLRQYIAWLPKCKLSAMSISTSPSAGLD